MEILALIPEFTDKPSSSEIEARIMDVPHLVLTAYHDDKPVGFKIGYERDNSFYSWLGAVLPEFRQSGIAARLADNQENWARHAGYSSVWMKTRNCFPEMLLMALGRGFSIIGFDSREEVSQHRIILAKSL